MTGLRSLFHALPPAPHYVLHVDKCIKHPFPCDKKGNVNLEFFAYKSIKYRIHKLYNMYNSDSDTVTMYGNFLSNMIIPN